MDAQVKRDKWIAARFDARERQIVERIARAERMKLSEVLRMIVREAGKSRGLWQPQLTESEAQPCQ
jgi:delta 1-pyrroline-5-carboxylate dehydrogenase